MVSRREIGKMWMLALLYLVLHLLVSTCLPERLAPLSTLFIILAQIAVIVAAWRVSRKLDSSIRLLWWLLAASVGFHAMAMSLDLFSEAFQLPVQNYVPGLSVYCSMLYGVPLLVAVSMPFDRRIVRVARATNALFSLAVGVLLYVQIFSLLTLQGSANRADAVLMLRMFDLLDLFLAAAATIRWFASDHPSERRFFRAIAIFLWVDALLVAIHNRVLIRHDYVWLDLCISAPYAVLAVLIMSSRNVPRPVTASHGTRILQGGSTIFLSVALLVMGVMTARTHFWLGLAAALLAILGYGTLSAFAQSRWREVEESLILSNETLEGLVGVDSLTGIPNRWAFDETLEKECASAWRARAPISLLMIDVDHFKLLNDSRGHQVGDACLIRIAGALRAALPRMTDFVGRYGGEEFSAILPTTNRRGAEAIALKLCHAIEELRLNHPTSPFGVVTVSIGVATCDGSTHPSATGLVWSADQALYEAKDGGRNRVESFAMDTVKAL